MSRTIQEAVDACYGQTKATARKSGRNPKWPYVAVVHHPPRVGLAAVDGRTEIVRGRAFETRPEAVAYAQRVIDGRKAKMAFDLAEPRMRAYRGQWDVEL